MRYSLCGMVSIERQQKNSLLYEGSIAIAFALRRVFCIDYKAAEPVYRHYNMRHHCRYDVRGRFKYIIFGFPSAFWAEEASLL